MKSPATTTISVAWNVAPTALDLNDLVGGLDGTRRQLDTTVHHDDQDHRKDRDCKFDRGRGGRLNMRSAFGAPLRRTTTIRPKAQLRLCPFIKMENSTRTSPPYFDQFV